MVRHPPLPVLLIGFLCVVSWALDDDEDNGKTLIYKVNQLLYDGWKFKAKASTHNRVYPPLHHPSPTLHLPPSAEAKHIQGFVAQRHEPDYCIELPYM